MVVASAFVLLMTPGLAFFYGGMVDKKHIISTMLQSFVALGVISVLWVLVGFSLCFGDSLGGMWETRGRSWRLGMWGSAPTQTLPARCRFCCSPCSN